MQSSKDKSSRFKAPSSTCTQQSRVVAVEVAVEPAVAPAPPAAVPAEAADAQAADRVAVDRPPEEDVAGVAAFIGLPFLGNEVGVGEQVVEDVRVQHGLVGQTLTELVALDVLATLLAVVEVELDLRRVEGELAALLVLFDFPAVGHEGVGIAVDDGAVHRRTLDELGDFGLHAARRLTEPLEVVPTHAEAVEKFHCGRDFGIRRFGNQVPHFGSPLSLNASGLTKGFGSP